ncbi:MAG: ATP phosphoribosyltransferase regulatory subunit [Proteobacteria bacterium]|nr:ATP phosphoribosyltransferase regulatory subunit [Pseudomonadota bacterium]
MKKKQNTLLPAGFRDSLLSEAEQESYAIAKLLEQFSCYGYRQVKPPMVEFEHSLLTGEGQGMKAQSFRLLDPGSRHMMALRADMTLQIARIAATRIADEPRPLRLSYAGEVFRVQGEGLFADRAITQVGAELIGVSDAAADAEAITLAAQSLEALGVEDIHVDLSLPSLPLVLLESVTKKSQQKALLAAIAKKDYDTLGRGGDIGKTLLALVECAGDSTSALKELARIKLPERAKKLVRELENLIGLLETQLPTTSITVDVLERRGFEFHTGISFALFSSANTNELGRGGRYLIRASGGDEPATGFTIILNNVLRILPKAKETDSVYAPIGTPAKDIAALRRKGTKVVQGFASANPRTEAKRLGCSSYLDKGKLLKI